MFKYNLTDVYCMTDKARTLKAELLRFVYRKWGGTKRDATHQCSSLL